MKTLALLIIAGIMSAASYSASATEPGETTTMNCYKNSQGRYICEERDEPEPDAPPPPPIIFKHKHV